MKKTILITLTLLSALLARANQPDSVYLFSYGAPDGSGGLRLAWSANRTAWTPLNRGGSFVNSDFGPWGSMKRMFNPHLTYSTADHLWHCTWQLSRDGQGTAHVTSPDLITWNPQTYSMTPAAAAPAQTTVTIGGHTHEGHILKVPYTLIETLQRYSDSRAYRDRLYAQTMADEPRMDPFKASITIHPDSLTPISTLLTGIFFEDINYAADGGLYAELLQNRDFEYTPEDNRHDRNWNHTYAWSTLKNGAPAPLTISTDRPVHPNNPHHVVLDNSTLTNTGWDGIPLKQGEKYRLTLFARQADVRGATTLTVSLRAKDGTTLATGNLTVKSPDWKKYALTLTPSQTIPDATLQIHTAGTPIALDLISLFPNATFKGRENGLRQDLAQTLADMHPRFIRFPGGCVAHGNGIDNIYDWKGSVGPLEARKPLRNIWNYHQTRGLGYYEYFQFCEDIGAQPLPVLAAGVPCQNSGIAAHHSCDHITTYGQQDGIPMAEMAAYIQDILDLIEWANGDPKKSPWARLRAQAGHPKPFNLKYIGIGNEDMITPVFESRFKMIVDSVRRHYPDITVVGTVGPFYEGTDYNRGWEFATEQNIPIVDEHYYVSPGWLVHNNDYYDNYDRTKPHVYLGEYAAHLPGRPNNIETALAEAIYLTGVERNGDVVSMSSYAPLLAKDQHTQWNPDLIYFNNTEVRPTPGYYVQQLYGLNPGTHYVASTLTADNRSDWAQPRLRNSVVKDAATGDIIIKIANLNPAQVTTDINLNGLLPVPATSKGKNSKQALASQRPVELTTTILTGAPADRRAKPVSSARTLTADETAQGKLTITLPDHSFTVLRLSAK